MKKSTIFIPNFQSIFVQKRAIPQFFRHKRKTGIPKAAVRSTAIFTLSPPGRGQGVGQLCMELTIKDDKIDLRGAFALCLDKPHRICYTVNDTRTRVFIVGMDTFLFFYKEW